MDKYKLLNLLKENVLTLYTKSVELQENAVFLNLWRQQGATIQAGIQSLNKDDKQWVDAEYNDWYKNTIEKNYTAEQKELSELLN